MLFESTTFSSPVPAKAELAIYSTSLPNVTEVTDFILDTNSGKTLIILSPMTTALISTFSAYLFQGKSTSGVELYQYSISTQ